MTGMMRADLAQFFGNNPRLLRAFEDQAREVTENSEGLRTTAEATQSLQQATVLTLSPNAELTNERVLQIGRGLSAVDSEGFLNLSTSDNIPVLNGGFTLTITLEGDSAVGIPLTGILATQSNTETLENKTLEAPKFSGLGNYVDDAAAAAGGVPVGGMYRNGSALMVRVA